MSFVRPEARAALRRWREVAIAALAGLFGVWVLAQGGLFFSAIGAILLAGAAGLAITALRRLRFARGAEAPGLVRIDEGAVAYFGPETGGIVALSELVRVEAVMIGGVPAWVLSQAEGGALTIPSGAMGAEALFDVFAALPGARMADFVAAHRGLDAQGGVRSVWRRDGTGDTARLAAPPPSRRP